MFYKKVYMYVDIQHKQATYITRALGSAKMRVHTVATESPNKTHLA